MRLVDVDNVYEVLTDYYHQRTEMQHRALKEALGRVPTVDPVKHGKWVELRPLKNIFVCSLCGQWGDYHWNYCPNCGAKMGEVEE